MAETKKPAAASAAVKAPAAKKTTTTAKKPAAAKVTAPKEAEVKVEAKPVEEKPVAAKKVSKGNGNKKPAYTTRFPPQCRAAAPHRPAWWSMDCTPHPPQPPDMAAVRARLQCRPAPGTSRRGWY